MNRAIRQALMLGAMIALFAVTPARAQSDFPSRPVDVIVPYAPGGVTDIIARTLSHELQSITGQTFVTENKPGATGIVAANFVKHAAPDGYTLMMGSTSQMSVMPGLKPGLPFDPAKDFAVLSLVGTTPYILLVNSRVSAKTIPELIQLMQDNPGKFNYSTSGVGSLPHLLGEMFKQKAKVEMTHIPYQGNSPGTVAAAAGDVQLTFDTLISARAFIDNGQLRPLGVTSAQPIDALLSVPAIASVLPGFTGESWLCLYAPAATPPVVLGRLRDAIGQAIQQPEFLKNAAAGGFAVPHLTVQQAEAFLRDDAARWRDVGRAANIVLD
jgi:tripartite-type tricarboxylate transporter receptor subunit TctC